MSGKWISVGASDPVVYHVDRDCIDGELRPATEADLRTSLRECNHCGERVQSILIEASKENV